MQAAAAEILCEINCKMALQVALPTHCFCCCSTALAWRSSDATPAAVTTTRRYVFKVYICVSIHERMSVCMYVSHGLVCIRLPHMYICMYVFTYACKHLYMYAHMCVCVCVCISVCLHVHSIHTRYTRKRVLEYCARFNPQHETRPFCTTTTTTRTHRARRVVTARQPCVAFAFCFCSWRARTYTIQNCCLCVCVCITRHAYDARTHQTHTTHTQNTSLSRCTVDARCNRCQLAFNRMFAAAEFPL